MGTRQLHAIYFQYVCFIFIFLDFDKILFGSIHYLIYFQGENRNDFVFTEANQKVRGIRHLKVYSSEVARGLPREKASHQSGLFWPQVTKLSLKSFKIIFGFVYLKRTLHSCLRTKFLIMLYSTETIYQRLGLEPMSWDLKPAKTQFGIRTHVAGIQIQPKPMVLVFRT